jgi:succinate dehydrogenase / fumarate reductase flavoprotein subunit
MKLVNPANRRKFEIIVVGSGLAGASAAASMGEMGYNVHCFFYQDSARRAHSVAAQGGINAAKNYRNDGDSIFRLFYDTVKGGRLPLPGSQRLPAGPGGQQHYRSMCGPGCALCP